MSEESTVWLFPSFSTTRPPTHGAPPRVRLEVAGDAAVLTRAARLLLVRIVVLDALGDGLAVGDLRRRHLHLDSVLALHALDVDLELELAHPVDDGLSGVGGGARPERRVFLGGPVGRL